MLTYGNVENLLAAGSEDPPVLSLYLELPKYLPGLRELPDRAHRLVRAAAEGAAGAGTGQVAAVQRDVLRFLQGGARNWLGHGVGIFLCRPAGVAEHIVLPAGLGERAVFASRPHVRPLLAALQRQPGYRVVVVSEEHAWLLRLTAERIGVAAWSAQAGPAAPPSAGWDWLGTRRAHETIEHFPFYRFSVAARLLAGADSASGEDEPLVIVGRPDAIARFRAVLTDPVQDQFAGHFVLDPVLATPARIRERADPVVRHHVDRAEQDLLARIRHEPPGGLATVGLADCLAAVNQRAVETLAVPAGDMVPGYACRRCGALSTNRSGCACGDVAPDTVPDLIEEMAVAIIRAGGRVRTVAGPPGGIAASLRSPVAGRARPAA